MKKVTVTQLRVTSVTIVDFLGLHLQFFSANMDYHSLFIFLVFASYLRTPQTL